MGVAFAEDTRGSQEASLFEYFAREGWGEVSFMQELPYDYSIFLENVMDPAHLPISHDGSHSSATRKNAQALVFEVTERTS